MFSTKTKFRRSLFPFLLLVNCIVFIVGCGSSSKEWKLAQSVNTVEAYREFLNSNPSENLAAEARSKIDTLSFLNAKNQHTISAYDKYLREFPQGSFVNEASQRQEKLFYYQRAEAENSLSAYDDFLLKFPNGTFAAEAKKRREHLYFNQQVSKENTIPAYVGYLEQYPNGMYIDSAQARIERLTYESTKSTDSVSVYLDYLKRYPDGAYKADALARIELSAFRAANKARNFDAYENYIRQYPNGTYVAMAKHSIATMAEAYQEAKVVRVVVNQSFYQKNSDGSKNALTGISLPIESVARRILSDHANKTAVGPDAKSFASTLTITTEGIALGKNYGTDTLHYSGASLTGTITLEMMGYPTFKRTFSYTLDPSPSPVTNSLNGSSAPFPKVFKSENSLLPKLLEVIYKIYGTSTLLSAIRDADESVRCAAMDVCGSFNIDAAFTSIINALRDNNFTVRQRAAISLGIYKDERAVEPIVRNLQEVLDFSWIKDESNEAREKAAIALGMIGSSKATKPLINALKDPSTNVRREASSALKKITSKDFGADYDAWMKWYDEKGNK